MEEARRRAMLAEALAQQQYEPMEGNAAPIPKAAPLVKALQGYLTAREGRKAREAAEEAKGMEADYAQRMLGRMQGGYTYQPDAELETQMAKRPEETLDQYTQRMQATPFVGRAAPVPEQTELGEVTRQSQYRRAPEEVLGMASTSLGTAALKDRPVMAQRLAQMLETPKAEEFYAPTETADGQLVQFGKGGGKRETGYTAPTKPTAGSSLAKLYDERSQFPSGDPRIAIWDKAIESEAGSKAPVIQMPSARDKQKDEGQLRDQLQSRLKDMDWSGIQKAYQRIFTAPETAVGDVAIVYAVAKGDDPTGAVRSEDFDLRAKEGSLGGRIKSLYEEAASGRMLPERRQQLIDAAYDLYKAREADVNALIGQYGNIAQRSELNVENVVEPFKSKSMERRVVWSKEKQDELDRLKRKRDGG
jgi:hypothetical protein